MIHRKATSLPLDGESPEIRWSLPPIDTQNPRSVTSAFSVSSEETGYLMEEDRIDERGCGVSRIEQAHFYAIDTLAAVSLYRSPPRQGSEMYIGFKVQNRNGRCHRKRSTTLPTVLEERKKRREYTSVAGRGRRYTGCRRSAVRARWMPDDFLKRCLQCTNSKYQLEPAPDSDGKSLVGVAISETLPVSSVVKFPNTGLRRERGGWYVVQGLGRPNCWSTSECRSSTRRLMPLQVGRYHYRIAGDEIPANEIIAWPLPYQDKHAIRQDLVLDPKRSVDLLPIQTPVSLPVPNRVLFRNRVPAYSSDRGSYLGSTRSPRLEADLGLSFECCFQLESFESFILLAWYAR
ncbi:hypothetical protein EVAR_100453_1 [Eumeta japonica]|uniref:Uncharacterized protein n=1 Tax=Eumeta variegata TaxID=151549 RepID=A0A4C1ZUS9_EUMVA|nr:hypothetical protein EVAR_100453_1 [Eumeta japonica]